MLARAYVRLEGLGLEDRVHLQEGDMRSFKLGQTFPLIIAPFNTFMHAYTLSDQDATLAAVKRHLAPGGLFALDLFNPNFSELNVLRREAEWESVGGPNSDLFLLQTHDPDAQLVTTRYYLDTVAEDGTLKRQITTLKQRYFTRFELERALRAAGEHLRGHSRQTGTTALRSSNVDNSPRRRSTFAAHLVTSRGNAERRTTAPPKTTFMNAC